MVQRGYGFRAQGTVTGTLAKLLSYRALVPRSAGAPAIRSRGFTLVELLVVIAILGLLAGLVGPQVMKQFGGAKVDAARLQIADLGAGLDVFFLDAGRYPNTNEGLDVLVRNPGSIQGWNGPYIKKSNVPEDPWGTAYQYVAPGEHGPYDLFSLGADGSVGGDGDAADITSWE